MPADPPVPRVTLRRLGPSVVEWNQPVRLRVRCSAACDVNVYSPSALTSVATTFAKAGHRTLELEPADTGAIAPRHGRTRLRVAYGPPGTAHPRVRTVFLKLRRRGTPRLPRIARLTAVRRGDDIRITVRLRRPSEHTSFSATGQTERGGTPVTARSGPAFNDGRKRITVTLHHTEGVRFVTLRMQPWRRQDSTTREIPVR